MRNTQPKNTNELKVTIKVNRASLTYQQCYMLISSMSHRGDAVISIKGSLTKTDDVNEHAF